MLTASLNGTLSGGVPYKTIITVHTTRLNAKVLHQNYLKIFCVPV